MPVDVELTGWSPFAPGDADNASLPVAALEYRLTNRSAHPLEAVFSCHAENFLATPGDPKNAQSRKTACIRDTAGGFILSESGTPAQPWEEGHLAIWVEEPDVRVNRNWFRGWKYDQMQIVWKDIVSGGSASANREPEYGSPGASLYAPIRIAPGQSKTIVLHLAWYVPKSDLFEPSFKSDGIQYEYFAHTTQQTYQPWYAGRFASIEEVKSYWSNEYQRLRGASDQFSRAFYDSTLPPEVLEAISANLAILKSTTVLRPIDGRLWSWEGSHEEIGSCYGTANHVWNYVQAVAHLFPDLERSVRETEFGPNQGADGYQAIRAALPVRPVGDSREDGYGFLSAADGQLGGLLKVHRDWRISGNTEWLRKLWPRIKASLDYCINTWDPKRRGWVEEPHVTTYDVEFWGADSICTIYYLAALKAAVLMGRALGQSVDDYSALLATGVDRVEANLFNGEYFFQKTELGTLKAKFPPREGAPMAARLRHFPAIMDLTDAEGPPYQYGAGCHADGVLGAWMGLVCGVGEVLDRKKVESHLKSVHRYNYKSNLALHVNHFRCMYAHGEEPGMVLCSWPKGNRPTLPFFFADEVWTGVEYQVASHLILLGHVEEGLEIVRACRQRYDGRTRNPFDEFEAGHWYVRAMASYALLQSLSGARFDAVDRVLYLEPVIKGDFRCFLATASGFGTVGVRNGRPFVEVVSGEIPYKDIKFTPRYR